MANDIIVDNGLTEILKRLLGLTENGTLYVGVGSGNAAPMGSDAALATETARVIASTSTVLGNAATVKAFFNTAQGNGNIGEHGLFAGAAGGVMIDRGIEAPAEAKTATQEMIVEKVITLTRG